MTVPSISLVVARAKNNVIGMDGDMPWRLRSDLQRFKAITTGKPCIMGRATWESLPLRPLPGRLNLVLSRDLSYEESGKAKGAVVVSSLSDALDIARETAEDDGVDEICVIGGSALFEAALPRAKRLYITEVDAEPEGDTFFPAFDESLFREVANDRHDAGDKDDHAFTFRILERI
ncbi:dihydrofolate reductase [Brevundimonas staleyi]|uniref:Dihydrofolate reductase n=1 Tax=Brevundimonas staleyi TaxID=74326 RepID=A0ABW0FQ89_9CAUL